MLSIDIGIKNLSYCLFEGNQIKDWGIINLTDSETPLCECGDSASFVGKEYYCKKHKPKCAVLPKPLEKMKLVDFKKIKRFQKCETREACVNGLEYVTKLANASTLDLISISRNIQTQFDKKWTDPIEIVIIENQISPLASRMKTIQGMITQYFVKNVPRIHYVSSGNKLKNVKTKMTYTERKKEAIQQCRQQLEGEWCDFFEKATKKDDLADCYLQGRWFITNKLEK